MKIVSEWIYVMEFHLFLMHDFRFFFNYFLLIFYSNLRFSYACHDRNVSFWASLYNPQKLPNTSSILCMF